MIRTTHPAPPPLEVDGFSVTLHTPNVSVRPVDRVTYSVEAGEVLAVVGESGSGKTILNMAPLDLLPVGVDADMAGSVRFEGRDLLKMTASELEAVRGSGIGVVFQDPLSALNPVRKVGRQLTEGIERNLRLTPAQSESRAAELLALVGLPDPKSRMQQYPHELSGGQRQRVGIAMGISGEPRLLIADEPTTALDVTVQAQIVELLKDLQKRMGMAIVIITHDFGVVSGLADKVAVMYAGRLSELGSVRDVLVGPAHPYTRGLLQSVPSLTVPMDTKFVGLPGQPPNLAHRIDGCAFAPRCAEVRADCRGHRPGLLSVPRSSPGHLAACPVVVNQNI
ncbi:ABC transporter ATP-binding protein [Fertoebacter nigrum]|uniref:ABC transporter ATP-binding protein n=1 Tax=Fertoeibacter niger TaxID=2656921 RepID=A0A8X8H267_9RHOB|nr:ABC transporter ATP-binding protein [Fertoeibacter niger]NUB45896.1 ABC transporter ATP-binding protein [Fertoeibacter niger]